jgi:hypothetical protein
VFTPFHKLPYPYLYGRSVDETTTVVVYALGLLVKGLLVVVVAAKDGVVLLAELGGLVL